MFLFIQDKCFPKCLMTRCGGGKLRILFFSLMFLAHFRPSFTQDSKFELLGNQGMLAQNQKGDVFKVFPSEISKIQLSSTIYNFLIGGKQEWRFNLRKVEGISIRDNQRLSEGNDVLKPIGVYLSKESADKLKEEVIQYSDSDLNSDLTQKSADPTIANSEPFDYSNIIFSTYFGGGDFDYSNAVATDADSNIFITGYTSSKNLPTTDGSYKKTSRISNFGEADVFISKFDKFGNLVVCTYFGSFVDDRATDIKINSKNEVVITGYVHQTTTFPTTPNAYDTTSSGFYDCFISIFDNTLANLKYSTLLGGRKDDYPMALDIDDLDFVYITGYTTEIKDSVFFPVTKYAYEQSYKGAYDVFVAKLTPDLSELTHSTLFGGNADDFAQDIKVTPSRGVLVTGVTKSNNLPTTGDAYQYLYNDLPGDSSKSDIFILKLSSNFDVLLYSSYFGGVGRDGAYSLTTDEDENIYITGFTESYNFPVTEGSYSQKNNLYFADENSGDVFVLKLKSSGRDLVFSTLMGGKSNERAYKIGINNKKQIYAAGYTNSVDFPISNFAFDKQLINETKSDGFIYKLSEDGSSLLFSSLFGGEDNDICKDFCVYSSDTQNDLVVLTGSTTSKTFPISEFGFDKEYNDTTKTDAFLSYLKIIDDKEVTYRYSICSSDSVTLKSTLIDSLDLVNHTYSYSWTPNIYLSDASVSEPICFPPQTIEYEFQAIRDDGWIGTDTIRVRVFSLQSTNISGDTIAIRGKLAKFSTQYQENSKYLWFVENGVIVSGQGTSSIEVDFMSSDSGKVYVEVENEFSCKGSSNILQVFIYNNINPKVLITKGSIPRCSADTLILDAGVFFTDVLWSNGVKNRFLEVTGSGKFSFSAKNIVGENVFSDTVNVTTIPSPNKPQIRLTNKEFRCITNAIAYQWFKDGILINGAVEKRYTYVDWGRYQCRITAQNGCYAFSESLITGIEDDLEDDERNGVVSICENDILKIHFTENSSFERANKVQLLVYNLLSDIVVNENIKIVGNELQIPFNFSDGVYFLQLINLGDNLLYSDTKYKDSIFQNIYKFIKK